MRNLIKTITILTSICLLAVVIFLFVSTEQRKPQQSVDSGRASPTTDSPNTLTDGHDLSASEMQASVDEQSDLNNKQRVTKTTPRLEPEIREALSEILNTSSEGLVEEPAAHGAVGLNHQGRFQTAPVATVDPEGNVQIRDYSSLPATGEQQ